MPDAPLLVVAAVLLAAGVLLPRARPWLLRRRVVRDLVRAHPDEARSIRRQLRRRQAWRPPAAPTDPHARTDRVVVPPLSGRPGFTFLAPGPSVPPMLRLAAPDQTLARVPLAEGTTLLVVCLGRAGSTVHGAPVLPAERTAASARDAVEAPARAVGPVRALDTPLGRAWRLTRSTGGPRTVSDTYVDRDGWTFVVGVLSPRERHGLAVAVLDDILTTWRWLPAEADPAPPR